MRVVDTPLDVGVFGVLEECPPNLDEQVGGDAGEAACNDGDRAQRVVVAHAEAAARWKAEEERRASVQDTAKQLRGPGKEEPGESASLAISAGNKLHDGLEGEESGSDAASCPDSLGLKLRFLEFLFPFITKHRDRVNNN